MAISREVIAQVLGCRNKGPNVEFKKHFVVSIGWSIVVTVRKFGVNWTHSWGNMKVVYYADNFQSLQHMLLYLFGTNVIPKKSGKNEVRHSDLFFLDILFHGSKEMRQCIPLPSIIIN